MNKNILILGAGQYGTVVKEIAESMGCFEKFDFLDDSFGSDNPNYHEEAIGKIENLDEHRVSYTYAIPAIGDADKRLIDIALSFCGIIVLAIPMLIISLIIIIDDPGPVVFKQKRVGIKKNRELTYFQLWKFRSMKMSTPHDVPTHLLENPEQYITKVGRVLRKTSLDELPQIFHIFSGKMSVIGPRPALWNQYDLIAEREKYGANDVTPGLTGWAQVNGRDEIEIDEKARLDGEYVSHITFKMDWTCFWMTVGSVLKHKGVIEGGTGVMAKQMEKQVKEVACVVADGVCSNEEVIK